MLTFLDRKWPGCSDCKSCKVSLLTFRDRKSPGLQRLKGLQGKYFNIW